MNSKKMDLGAKDLISRLPDAVICHILSFLSTKESALTSILSKKWRYLFASVPNLEFDDSVYLHKRKSDKTPTSFMCFVDRVLALQGNSVVDKFSLKCGEDVNSGCVTRWIHNVLERGVSDLNLCLNVLWSKIILPKVFVSKSLVRLRIETECCISLEIDMGDFCLPKLKTLYLNLIVLRNGENNLGKFISGCQFLEEFVMINVYSELLNHCVSSKTLKRLTLICHMLQISSSVLFDTPNLVYLEYSDHVADEYTKVNFDSLVEANISIKMTDDQRAYASYGDLVSNATTFFMGICNVQILHLSADTLEFLTYCCEIIPVFSNLTHLTIETRPRAGWESLPALLNNCPVLQTLVFEGLYHKETVKCWGADGCLCNIFSNIHTCLSSSPVKMIKVLRFGPFGVSNIREQVEQIKHFLKTMSNLEEVMLYYNTPIKQDVFDVSNQLLKLPRVASPKCNIQVISDIIGLSITVTLYSD